MSPDRISAQQWLVGTGLSAPAVMLIAQAAFAASLAIRPSGGSARGLAVLGALTSCGYLSEVGFPEALLHPDRERTPLLLSVSCLQWPWQCWASVCRAAADRRTRHLAR